MKKLWLTIFFLLLAGQAWATTYYVRADGTVTAKASATSCGAAATALSIVAHNQETFSGDDIIVACDDGGTYQLYNPNFKVSDYPTTKFMYNPFDYIISGVKYTKAAGSLTGALSGSAVPNGGLYGAWGIDINAAGAVSATEATNNSTGYATSVLALAGIPAVAEGYARLGTIYIINSSAGNFTPNTTALDAAGITATCATTSSLEFFTPPSSGSVDHPIVYQASGTPLFDGGVNVMGTTGNWTVDSGNTWKKTALPVFVNGPASIILNGYHGQQGTYANRASFDIANPTSFGIWTYLYTGTLYVATAGTDAPNNPATYFSSIVQSASKRGMYFNGVNYINVSGLSFKNIGNNGGVLATIPYGGISINASDNINTSYITCSDSLTCGAASNSTNITFDHFTITKTVANNSISDLATGGKGVGIWTSALNTHITNITYDGRFTPYGGISQNGGNGIRIFSVTAGGNSSATAPYVAYNTISYPYNYGINMQCYDTVGGIQTISGIIEHNTLTNGNPTGGIDDDGLSCGDTATFGVGNYCTGLIFRHNGVDGYGNSGGQSTNSWRNVEWGHNVISNCGSATGSSGWGGIAAGAYDSVYNNTIYNVVRSGIRASGAGTFIKNNIVHTVSKDSSENYGFAIEGGAGGSSYNNDLYNYAAATAVQNWTDTNGIETDPLFVSTVTPDFHLQGASPAKAAGVNLGTGYTDYDSVSLPTPYGWCIGALCYNSFGGSSGSFSGSIQ